MDNVEKVAEALWQAEAMRVTGRKRLEPWSEVEGSRQDQFRFSAQAALQSIGWQPIETAPKGEYVLGYFGDGAPMAGSQFATCKQYGNGWLCDEGEFLYAKPTHWQPLPEPPAALKGDSDRG